MRVCPMGLLPNMISVLSENNKHEGTLRYNIADCVECGSCVYVCPAKRPIVGQIKYSKFEIRKNQHHA